MRPAKSPRRPGSTFSTSSSQPASPAPFDAASVPMYIMDSPQASQCNGLDSPLSRPASSTLEGRPALSQQSSTSSKSTNSDRLLSASEGYETAPTALPEKDVRSRSQLAPLQIPSSPVSRHSQQGKLDTDDEEVSSQMLSTSASETEENIQRRSSSPVSRRRLAHHRTSIVPISSNAIASTSSGSPRPRQKRQSSYTGSIASVSSSKTTSSRPRILKDASEDEDEDYFSPVGKGSSISPDVLSTSPANPKRSPTTSLRNSPRRTGSPSIRAVAVAEGPSSPSRHWHARLPSEPVPSLPAAFARPRTSPSHTRSVSDAGPPSPTSVKGKGPAYPLRHSYFPEAGSITRPASSGRESSWTRASQAPSSMDPFQYDLQSPSESEQLEREFLQAIERRQISAAADGSALPINEQSPHRRTPSPTTPFYSPRSRASSLLSRRSNSPSQEKAIFRGSRYDSGIPGSPEDEHGWTLPVVSSSPVRSNSIRSHRRQITHPEVSPKALIEEFSNRWSLDSLQASASGNGEKTSSDQVEETPDVSVYAAHLRSSEGTADPRRMGRIFGSLSSESSNAKERDLETPRGSVSQQGAVPQRMARHLSIYATPSLDGPDAWPGKYISEEDSTGNVTDSKRLSSAPENQPNTGLPEIESAALSSNLNEFKDLDQTLTLNAPSKMEDLPPTPAATDYSESQLSLASDSVSETASSLAFVLSPNAGNGISEEEKQELRRQRTITELVETESTFAQDMAVARDVWLARAKGKELGEIIAMLQVGEWVLQQDNPSEYAARQRSISHSEGRSPLPGSTPIFSERQSGVSAPTMVKNASATSLRSLNRLTSGLSLPKPSSSSSRKLSGDLDKLPASLSRSTPASSASGSGASNLNGSRMTTAALHIRKRPTSEVMTAGSALVAPLSVADCRVIFINLEDVAAFSETFLAVLQACGEEGETKDTYGEAFLSMVSSDHMLQLILEG